MFDFLTSKRPDDRLCCCLCQFHQTGAVCVWQFSLMKNVVFIPMKTLYLIVLKAIKAAVSIWRCCEPLAIRYLSWIDSWTAAV